MPGKYKDRKEPEPVLKIVGAGADGVDGVRLTNIQNALPIMNVAPVPNPVLPVILLPAIPIPMAVLIIPVPILILEAILIPIAEVNVLPHHRLLHLHHPLHLNHQAVLPFL